MQCSTLHIKSSRLVELITKNYDVALVVNYATKANNKETDGLLVGKLVSQYLNLLKNTQYQTVIVLYSAGGLLQSPSSCYSTQGYHGR